ncbi:uncharacterized protein DS421_5g147580 [Arachis hypogaea]|nr:uncharacterized protein DS421_5g147580 [Arachis hypogaea]
MKNKTKLRPKMSNTIVKYPIYTRLATRVYMSKYLMHSGAHLVYVWAELDLSMS